MSTERRFHIGAPVRVEKRADGSRAAVGYAAVFFDPSDPGTEYRLWSNLYERIAPGAFDRAIRDGDDAAGLFNHNPDHLLGRVSAKTLRLSTDAKGLRYEIELPDTTAGRDLPAMIERGDLKGSSFSFNVEKATWIEEGDREIRQLESVRLFDVGPVTFPAYGATTTGLRAVGGVEEARRARDEWRRGQEAAATRLARLRLAEAELKS